MWRGYSARIPLKLAGKGVLKRALCVNDDEMITMESKDRLHPYDFFSLEEGDKVWFFDQKTIFQWAQKTLTVQNPYTRKELSNEDTSRIRRLYVWRRRNKMEVFHDVQPQLTETEKRDKRWLRIAQIMREAGYSDIHHEHFICFNYPQMATFVNSVTEDMRWWTNEKPGRSSKYFKWLLNMRNIMHTYTHNVALSSDIASIILTILLDIHKIYEVCFHVYSGYARAVEIINIGWMI
jgi:hypothetical protein